MKRLIFGILFGWLMTGEAVAAFWAGASGPDAIGSISILLEDQARGDCWTNLQEARDYAAEALRRKGYDVVPNDGDYTFRIVTNAVREDRGTCVGSVAVVVQRPARVGGLWGFHEIGASDGIAVRNGNLNAYVLEHIRALAAEM